MLASGTNMFVPQIITVLLMCTICFYYDLSLYMRLSKVSQTHPKDTCKVCHRHRVTGLVSRGIAAPSKTTPRVLNFSIAMEGNGVIQQIVRKRQEPRFTYMCIMLRLNL